MEQVENGYNSGNVVITQPRIKTKKKKLESEELKIELSEYSLQIQLDGLVCMTSATMTFYNPFDQVLEGELVFPLPEGVTISGYALDINGVLVDAVAVTKEKARVTFEKEERRRVDPGIVEWVQGNQFRTRIYPLPPKGKRIVRVDTVSTIQYDEERNAAVCRIPQNFEEPVAKYSIDIKVRPLLTTEKAADVLLNAEDWQDAGFHFLDKKQEWVAKLSRNSFQPQHDIVIALPQADIETAQFMKSGNGLFMAVPVDTQALTFSPGEQMERSPISTENVTVFWDCSGSRDGKGGSGNPEPTLLAKILRSASVASVRLIPVRNEICEQEIVTFNEKTSDDLIGSVLDAIEQLPCDGASCPSLIKNYLRVGELPLLFTDGMFNWSDSIIPKLNSPLFIFSSGPVFNASYLQKFASSGGGCYYNLNGVPTDLTAKLLMDSLQKGVLYASVRGENVDIYPSEISLSGNQRYIFLCGRVSDENSPVTINVQEASKSLWTDQYATKLWSDAPQGNLLEKLFAQSKLIDLLTDEKNNESEITKLGFQFQQVTPFTSLIVLETFQQYLEHEICPPESLPDMRRQFLERKQKESLTKEELKQKRFDYVSRIWNSRVQWWEQDLESKREAELRRLFERIERPSSEERQRQIDAKRFRSAQRGERQRLIERQCSFEMPSVFEARIAEDSYCQEEREMCDRMVLHSYRETAFQSEEAPCQQKSSDASPSGSVVIKPWTSNAEYLNNLNAQKNKIEKAYQVYLNARRNNEKSPLFYIECADWFDTHGFRFLAVRILSNLTEMELEDPQILRVLGHRLQQWEELDLAAEVFEKVLKLRPEEPQSYRDLALVLGERGTVAVRSGYVESGKADLTRAFDLFNTIVWGRDYKNWDSRFPEIEVIALEDANALIPLAEEVGMTDFRIDQRFVKLLDVDIRIVLTWHTDNTDLDLWVIEPNQEKVYYQNPRSHSGGIISCDYRDGYGPEEYLIRKALPGHYSIIAHFFSSRAVELFGAVIAQADVFTNYGRKNQTVQRLTFPLTNAGKDTYTLGEIEF